MKCVRLLLMVGVLAGGCAGAQHRLDAKARTVTGSFSHEGPRVSIQLDGHEYVAENFEVMRAQDRARLRARYGTGPHYTAIVAGLDRDHDDYYAEPTLSFGDAKMMCALGWRGDKPPHGRCTLQDGRSFAVAFR